MKKRLGIYDKVPVDFTGNVEWTNNSRAWYLNGKFHREDGPAVEWASGDKAWFLNGEKVFYLQQNFPFLLIEKLEEEKQIKVLTKQGIEIWPNLPGLKELADNWENSNHENNKH
jgi:hypothetical protein